MTQSDRQAVVAAGVFAGLVVLLLAAGGSATAANMIAIDDNHDLATEDAAAQYQDKGSVSTEVDRLQMSISVHESADQAGVDEFATDFNSHYLRVQYEEDIPRTVRFEMPAEYWHPHPQQDQQAINSDATMDMEPDAGLNNSVVTVHFDGQTDAVFRIDRGAAGYFQLREGVNVAVEDQTGWSLPSIAGGSKKWEYVDSKHLETQDTVPVNASADELTLQYDELKQSNSDRRWIEVPACSQSRADDAPVCTITPDEKDYVLLAVQENDPPDVRYKHNAGFMPSLRSAIGDLSGVVDRASESVNGLLERVNP